ncbi:Aspartic proteinase CDR1 [Melia azedarach]|uniref:Aspartic proteinase CDR1 n=1 Tax=Melia azedarach TaxID=155640 RepID=A0ACC1XNJ2_MELAZ|nr:Aspartic proteinase CDR1 [Melia azedarach]
MSSTSSTKIFFPAFLVTVVLFSTDSFCSPLFLNSSSSPLKGKDIGFSVRLIHRSSPESPFYNANATPLDLVRTSLRTSSARTAYFSRLRSKNFSYSMKYPLSPVDLFNASNYAMRYSIGTPPMETFAIPDTGSSLTWLQCLNCTSCYNQSIPVFDPSKSSSYKPVLRGTKDCNNSAYPDDDCQGSQPILCTYSVTYEDATYSIGNIARETVTFKDNSQGNENYRLLNMIFGCGHSSTDNPGANPPHPGVVSLSNHSFSLVRQLGFDFFSYCMSSDVSNGHSQIRFGLASDISSHFLTTSLFPNQEFYFFKDVDGIYVDGEKLDIPDRLFQFSEGAGMMIDTGTTYTQLHTLVMDVLIQKIKKKMPSEMKVEEDINKDWELCYAHKYRFIKVLPEIELRFKGNKDSYPLSDQNAWIDNDEGQFCLAMDRTDAELSVLGLYQLRDVNVGINLKQAQISFVYDFDCPDYA